MAQLQAWPRCLLLLALLCASASPTDNKTKRSVLVTAEEEKVRDKAGYDAIAEIHKDMDDDNSGSIDRAETTGFMTEDMNMRGSDTQRRQNRFHADDDAITVDDLWEAWFESAERSWDTEQVIFWMSNVVGLPQYAEIIAKYKYDGRILPRLAAPSSSFLTQTMNIKSSVHRQKIRLSALDVVLFGYRESHHYIKDIALCSLVLLFTVLLIMFFNQKRRAALKVNQLNEKLTQLKILETEFAEAQKQLEVRDQTHNASHDSHAEVEHLRNELAEAHKRLGNLAECTSSSAPPLALQPLLRKTWEIELKIAEAEKKTCIEEMKLAMEEINNVAKKQTSFLNSLKLATGGNTGADKVDSQIYFIKTRMERVQVGTREMHERWSQIEALCGFPILYANETPLPARTVGSSAMFRTGSSTTSLHSLPKAPSRTGNAEGGTSIRSTTAPSSEASAQSAAKSANTDTTAEKSINSSATFQNSELSKTSAHDSSSSFYASNEKLNDTSSLSGRTVKSSSKNPGEKKKFFGLFKNRNSKKNGDAYPLNSTELSY